MKDFTLNPDNPEPLNGTEEIPAQGNIPIKITPSDISEFTLKQLNDELTPVESAEGITLLVAGPDGPQTVPADDIVALAGQATIAIKDHGDEVGSATTLNFAGSLSATQDSENLISVTVDVPTPTVAVSADGDFVRDASAINFTGGAFEVSFGDDEGSVNVSAAAPTISIADDDGIVGEADTIKFIGEDWILEQDEGISGQINVSVNIPEPAPTGITIFDNGSFVSGEATTLNFYGSVDVATSEDPSYVSISVTGAPAASYSIPFFFTEAPQVNETMLIHAFAEAVTFDVQFSGYGFKVGNAPASSSQFKIYKNATQIGTMTFDTTGDVFVAQVGFTPYSFAANDVLKVVAPSTATTIQNTAFTFKGSRG